MTQQHEPQMSPVYKRKAEREVNLSEPRPLVKPSKQNQQSRNRRSGLWGFLRPDFEQQWI